MALEFMHNEMLRYLKKISSSVEALDKYQIAWSNAISNSGNPIPCPDCFAGGEICRLKPLPDEKGISSARCTTCRKKYEWQSPE